MEPFIYGSDAAALVHTKIVEGRRVIDRLVIIGPDITAATLRKLPMGPLTAYAERGQHVAGNKIRRLDGAIYGLNADGAIDVAFAKPKARAPLTRPDGTDPVGFSRRVAAAYNEAVLSTSTPAKMLAAEAGVPVTTVHRWVRDARRLGLLPPARKGRAG